MGFTNSLDVIGHELTHGVTQFTSGLEYEKQRKNSNSGYGFIEVHYGYQNFDEDEKPSDGLNEEINFYLENILEACEEIYDQINSQIEEEKTTLNCLKNSMGL
ncbi:hypothetical protein [Fictibacillus sp. NRS-1165]|uniref:hypothetical protein n=1 Tax=Fictibacillus sp. NRS-1165 TaxID=3144463 RepID=UPI003D25E00D